MRDDDAALARFAESVLPAVALQLREAIWDGLLLSEPVDERAWRARLEHPARLVVASTGRRYSVAANLFRSIGRETAPHDHRYPLAVFPFAIDDDLTSALYEMQWAEGGGSSVVTVFPAATWAVAEPSRVRHTVKSLRPHASIVIADVTEAPTRPQRLESQRMAAAEVTRVRTIVRDSLARAIPDRLPPQWHQRVELERRFARRDPTVTD